MKIKKVAEVYKTSSGHYERNLRNGKWYIYRGSFPETEFQAELEAAYQRQLEEEKQKEGA